MFYYFVIILVSYYNSYSIKNKNQIQKLKKNCPEKGIIISHYFKKYPEKQKILCKGYIACKVLKSAKNFVWDYSRVFL